MVCVFNGLRNDRDRARELNPTPGMTPWSLRPPKPETDAAGRNEMLIAVVTIYVIVVSILACEFVTRVYDHTETKSTVSRYRTHNV